MKKFTDVIDIDDYEVLTDIGFVDIKRVMQTIKYKKYGLHFSDGNYMECADNHLLIKSDGESVYAKDSLHCSIKSRGGDVKVIKIVDTGEYEHMYDLELSEHHLYYTDNILSHNTTIVAGYLLHLALFSENYTIALLANKREQAAEVLDRIKMMYENLPWWLQVGVRRWNVNDILLDNGKKGTSIFTAATTGTSVRGKSLNCLSGTSLVTLKDNETDEVFEIDMESLFKALEDIYGDEKL